MTEKLTTLSIGAGGLGVAELSNNIDFSNVVDIVVKIAIGIATLIGLFKNNKQPKTK